MNKEEIIADLKKTIEYAQNCCREDAYINQETLFAVLNLLEKKDRTIQQLKDENKTLNRQAQQYFETTIIQSQQYDKETTKNDKIIDEMAKEFRTKTLMYSDMSKEGIKQYFERKVENGN